MMVNDVYRGLTLTGLMSFLTRGPLRHSSGEVRDKAEQLIVSLYKKIGAPVRQYLSNADENTRKSLLYKQLFKAFDECDASRGGCEVIAVAADDDNNNVRHGDRVNKKPDTLGNKRDNKVCMKCARSSVMIVSFSARCRASSSRNPFYSNKSSSAYVCWLSEQSVTYHSMHASLTWWSMKIRLFLIVMFIPLILLDFPRTVPQMIHID